MKNYFKFPGFSGFQTFQAFQPFLNNSKQFNISNNFLTNFKQISSKFSGIHAADNQNELTLVKMN